MWEVLNIWQHGTFESLTVPEIKLLAIGFFFVLIFFIKIIIDEYNFNYQL